MKRGSAIWFTGISNAMALLSSALVLLSSAILLSSPMALAAQNAVPRPQGLGVAGTAGQPNQLTALRLAPPAMGCPVSLRAQHLADFGMVRTGNTHREGVGQRLHMALTDNRASKIVRATVTVHGYSNKARLTESAMGSGGSDAALTVTVPFYSAPPGAPSGSPSELAAGDVWVAGMTAVATVDLDSVTYADGSVWKFAGQAACRFTPDPLMLVAGR
jgi:hypothetical protein